MTFLQKGGPAALLENLANRTRLLNDNSSARIWTWDLSDEGNDKGCADVDGFDTRYAANFLQNACADPAPCDIRISDVSGAFDTELLIQIPPLKAPVALTYRLSSEVSDGRRLSREQSVCALSVDEAPTIVDDRVLSGKRKKPGHVVHRRRGIRRLWWISK